MGIHGYSWNQLKPLDSMQIHGNPWEFMESMRTKGFHGNAWGFMEINANQRIPWKDTDEIQWESMGFMEIHRNLWNPMKTNGFFTSFDEMLNPF